jgi:outer membrane protein TolC
MKEQRQIDLKLIDRRYVGRMRRFLPLFAALSLLAVSANALTVDEAVKQARDHNLGMAIEDLKLAQKKDEKDFSSNRLYPTVDVNSTVLRLNNLNFEQDALLWDGIFGTLATSTKGAVPYTDSSSFTSQITDDDRWLLSLGVKVQWILNPAVFRGIAQTLVDYNNAVLSRETAAAKLDRDVRKAFYQLLALHAATDVFQSRLSVAADRYRVAKANADAGLGSEIASLQAQVAFENDKPALADQKVNETNAQSAFRLLINVPANTDLNLEGTLDVDPDLIKVLGDIDVEALVTRYLEGRWDVAGAKGTEASLRNVAQLQADSLWPSLILGWSADPSVQAPFTSSTWSNPVISKYNWAQTNGALSLTLDWKLDSFIPGSTTGVEIKGRERTAEQARIAIEQARRAGENEIRSLVGQLKKSAQSLDGLSLALTLAEKSAKLTQNGYQAGTQSFTDAQDADLQLQTARLQYLNEELALQSTLADLDYALAADRKEWLHG